MKKSTISTNQVKASKCIELENRGAPTKCSHMITGPCDYYIYLEQDNMSKNSVLIQCNGNARWLKKKERNNNNKNEDLHKDNIKSKYKMVQTFF